MKIIYNSFIPFKGFIGVNLFGTIFVRKEYVGALQTDFFTHEYRHTLQMQRDGYVNFYIRYLYEYVRGLIKYKDSRKAYHNVNYKVEAFNSN